MSCAAADDNVANEDSSPAQNALSATIKCDKCMWTQNKSADALQLCDINTGCCDR